MAGNVDEGEARSIFIQDQDAKRGLGKAPRRVGQASWMVVKASLVGLKPARLRTRGCHLHGVSCSSWCCMWSPSPIDLIMPRQRRIGSGSEELKENPVPFPVLQTRFSPPATGIVLAIQVAGSVT